VGGVELLERNHPGAKCSPASENRSVQVFAGFDVGKGRKPGRNRTANQRPKRMSLA
jgi:hypothetical protein